MARLSEQIIAGLTRPSFSRGMFQAGQAIGAVPGMMRQQRRRAEEEQRQKDITSGLFGLEQMIAQGVDPAAPMAELQDLRADPALISQYAQRGQAAADKSQRDMREAEIERGRKKLAQMLSSPNFDFERPEDNQAYQAAVEYFKVPQEIGAQIYNSMKPSRLDDEGYFAPTNLGIFKDTVGGKEYLYTAQNIRRKDGSIGIEFEPITPDAPVQPTNPKLVSKLGETPSEIQTREVETKTETERQLDFNEIQQNAAVNYSKTLEAVRSTQTLLNVLDEIDNRGGSLAAFESEVKQALGAIPPNEAVFKVMAKNRVLGQLRTLGANPTEGERAFLLDLQANLEQTKEANTMLLQNALDELTRMADRQLFSQTATDRKQYVNYVKNQYAEDTPKRMRYNPKTGELEPVGG